MYFDNLHTPEEIKKEFRRLAMLHHPDKGGNKATMQAIIEEYHAALAAVNGYQTTGTDGQEHAYTYRHDTEQAIVDKINELLALHLEGVNIWLVGLWIWVDGNTRPHRGALKRAKLSWHSKRRKWYWKPYKGRSAHSPASFEGLCWKYGVELHQEEQEQENGLRTRVA